MDNACALTVPAERDCCIGAPSQDRLDLVRHLGTARSAAIASDAGHVGSIVDSLECNGTGAQVGYELLEHGWACDAADIARLIGTAGKLREQSV